jgi:hypothetical protein
MVRKRRFASQVKTAASCNEMLEKAGLARTLRPRLDVLVPLLAYAELQDEDDEDMHTRWAALLANAVADDGPNEVMQSFPKILAEIGSAEARLLDWLVQQPAGSNLDTFMAQAGYDPTTPGAEPYDAYVGNLERLGLCEVRRPSPDIRAMKTELDKKFRQIDKRSGFGFNLRDVTWPVVQMTPLGKAFVRACTPPTTWSEGADTDPDPDA